MNALTSSGSGLAGPARGTPLFYINSSRPRRSR